MAYIRPLSSNFGKFFLLVALFGWLTSCKDCVEIERGQVFVFYEENRNVDQLKVYGLKDGEKIEWEWNENTRGRMDLPLALDGASKFQVNTRYRNDDNEHREVVDTLYLEYTLRAVFDNDCDYHVMEFE